ncbi:hypothetical protein IQ07DRAFT_351755 [Pyrenochaeta sp. DS3sAY3a]|nr:hypothetical protein IQ07DRAFT_351755 [Pyrenochaeta sp. DS3sAY3a]
MSICHETAGLPRSLRHRHNQDYLTLASACEQCYRIKIKCIFVTNQKSCMRCIRLGRTCQTRAKKRMGRHPVVNQFGGGKSLVFALTKDIIHTESNCNAGDTTRLDRWPPIPSLAKQTSFQSNLTSFSPPVPASISAPTRVGTSWYSQINHILTTRRGFFQTHRRFMIGESFIDGFHSTIRMLFHHSPHALADAYVALLELIHHEKRQSVILRDLDMSLSSRCLYHFVKLLSAIRSVEEAAVAIMLGQVLLAYNAILPLGSSTRIIARGTLWGVRAWYPILLRRPEYDSIVIAPVLVDTIDCLVRREVPVLRLLATERTIVDRFSGICSSLLPLLYDLCECSHRATTGGDYDTEHHVDDPYQDVEKRIMGWIPAIPPELSPIYTSREREAMLAIASSYRVASLLIIHRLRNPFGVDDAAASLYAKQILDDVSSLMPWASGGATGLAVDFPLLIAMIELPVHGQNIFTSLEPLRYRKRQAECILEFVNYVTTARQSGYRGLWFDLVQEGFMGDFLP